MGECLDDAERCGGENCRVACDCSEECEGDDTTAGWRNNYFSNAMWHWMRFHQNMIRFYRSRRIKSIPDEDMNEFWRKSRFDGCDECATEEHLKAREMENRTGRRSWPNRGALTRKNRFSKYKERFDVDNDDDHFQMELDEDFKKFLEISERHRQERDKLKKQASKNNKRKNDKLTRTEENEDCVDYIDVSKRPLLPTTDAPQTVDNMKECKKLYGSQAEEILVLEASIQLTFDKFCDTYKPVYWPYIPLKF